MDEKTFDRLSRRIAALATRRGVLRAIPAVVGAGVLSLQPSRKVAAFPNSCERFILSAGKNVTKEIDVDDDLSVFLNDKAIFRDNDGVIGIGLKAIEPIRFRARVGDTLRIVARDGEGPCHSLSPLWLHCRDGGEPRKLTNGVNAECGSNNSVGKFFDKKFRI